jgi:hypothetical protein
LFQHLRYHDENGDNVIKKPSMFNRTDEGYSGDRDKCDANGDDSIDGQEAWRCLFSGEPEHGVFYDSSPGAFVLKEIEAGRQQTLERRLTELAANTPGLSAEARKRLVEGMIIAGLKMRDLKMLTMAYDVYGSRAEQTEQDDALQGLFAGFEIKSAIEKDYNESTLSVFRTQQLIPFLVKKFNEAQNYLPAFSWLCSLAATDGSFSDLQSKYCHQLPPSEVEGNDPYKSLKVPKEVGAALAADSASVSRLVQKIIANDAASKAMKECAARLVATRGDTAVKQLIAEMNKDFPAAADKTVAAKVDVLLSLPLGKDTPAAVELRKMLGPFLTKMKAGTDEKSDYQIFHDICTGCDSDNKIEERLTAIGLNETEINLVLVAAFDREHKMSREEQELAEKFKVNGVCTLAFKGGYAASKDDGGDGPGYHEPASVTLNLKDCRTRNPMRGLLVHFGYTYSAYTSYMSAKVKLSFGGATNDRFYRDDSEAIVLLPGRADKLNVEVWQGDHLATARVQRLYKVY